MDQVLSGVFWRLWRSVAVGNLADGVVLAALPLLVVRYTTDPLVVAGVTTAISLPWLFVLLVGASVDRGDRRLLLALSGLVRAVVLVAVAAALVAVGAGSAAVLLVYGAAVTLGVAEMFAETAAGALIPTVSPVALLPRANARVKGAQLIANEFIGPSAAGVLVAASAGLALGIPAAAYLVAGLIALRLPSLPRRPTTGLRLRSSLADGVVFVRRDPALRRLVLMTGVWNFGSGTAFSILVLFAVAPGPLGLSEPQYGLLLASAGVGGLVGSLVTERLLAILGFRTLIVLALSVGAASLATPAVSTTPLIIAAALAAGGTAAVAVGITVVSLRQRLTPDELLGRVNAAFWTASAGLYPVGALTGGLLAGWLGLRPTFLAAGLITACGIYAAATVSTEEPTA